jgi:uncharacterized protein YecE (DUF72 family)
LRHALEARDESYRVPELAALARRYGVALVVSDSGDGPRIEEISSDFVYVRPTDQRASPSARPPRCVRVLRQ